MNLSTGIILLVLIIIVALVVHKIIKDRKSGKTCSCGGSCSGCAGSCGAGQDRKSQLEK